MSNGHNTRSWKDSRRAHNILHLIVPRVTNSFLVYLGRCRKNLAKWDMRVRNPNSQKYVCMASKRAIEVATYWSGVI